MPLPKVVVSRSTLDEVARSRKVSDALEAKAQRMLPRAVRLALAAGEVDFANALHIENGIRPGSKSPKGIKRPYWRVIADTENAEDIENGNAGVTRQSILKRSMGA
jgi:hypothetical protein